MSPNLIISNEPTKKELIIAQKNTITATYRQSFVQEEQSLTSSKQRCLVSCHSVCCLLNVFNILGFGQISVAQCNLSKRKWIKGEAGRPKIRWPSLVPISCNCRKNTHLHCNFICSGHHLIFLMTGQSYLIGLWEFFQKLLFLQKMAAMALLSQRAKAKYH